MAPNIYGLILAISIFVGWLVARKLAPRFGIPAKDVDDALPWIVICGLVGARLYYVIFSWDYFRAHPADILAIWKGGISIYGGILGGIGGIWGYTKKNKLSFWRLVDLIALVAPLGQAIGRWGNYVNQEAFGTYTDLPWGIYIAPDRRPLEYLDVQKFHPAFLYESLWSLAVFAILLKLTPTSSPPSFQEGEKRCGVIAGAYLIFYGIGRFMIESIRLDSFYINNFRVDQITSLLIILLGIGIIIYSHARKALENT